MKTILCLLSAAVLHSAAPRYAAASDEETSGSFDAGPQLTLHGFSDVTFSFFRNTVDGGESSTENAFALGQFDLYIVSRLSQNISFLGETVFEMGPDGESVVDIERTFIKYARSDQINLVAGRTHTALGYWNEAYHHGALLQPTIERPEVLKFEDEGGMLPVHAMGLEMSGGWWSDSWGFTYVANLANGRGLIPDAVQTASDVNDHKATALKLTLAIEGDNLLEFGPAFYQDRIPADPSTPGRENEISELIPAAHMHAEVAGIMLLSEYYHVRHEDRGSSEVWSHEGWYAIASSTRGMVRPYGGFDRLVFDAADPFYASDDRDLSRVIAGLRFEFNTFNAVKVEYNHDWRQMEESDALRVQTAFMF